MPQVHYTIKEGLAELVLDNGPQNRLTDQMCADLVAGLEQAQEDGARAILLHAAGDHFSCGGDIVPWSEMELHELRLMAETAMDAFNRLERVTVPVVAAVRGLCLGGGFEMALRTDVIFAGSSAKFGHPEQSIGIVTVLGGIYRVAARAGRARAMEWALTSEQVSAERMAAAGVINHVLPDDDVLEAARAFARRVASGPTRAHAAHKSMLRSWEAMGALGADGLTIDLAMPLFETEDARKALPAAAEAFLAGAPRPQFDFQGR